MQHEGGARIFDGWNYRLIAWEGWNQNLSMVPTPELRSSGRSKTPLWLANRQVYLISILSLYFILLNYRHCWNNTWSVCKTWHQCGWHHMLLTVFHSMAAQVSAKRDCRVEEVLMAMAFRRNVGRMYRI